MIEQVDVAPNPEPSTPPPFHPDPALIDHLEGNTWSLRGYRRVAEELSTKHQA